MLATSLPPPPNPFVGRRPELKELFSAGKAGGVAIHIEGPSGMGKSALIARAVRRLRAGRVPFWFAVRGASSARHFTLSLAHALAPIGARQLAYYAQLPREPNGREVADLARRALASHQLLAVIDDAQQAAPDLRAFLKEFCSAFIHVDRPDLVIFASQESPYLELEGAKLRALRLEGIDRSAAHALTDRRGGLGERFEAVFKASRGSPLLLQLALSAPEADISTTSLPRAVVSRLSELDVEGLLAAAISDEPVPVSFLQEVGSLTSERIGELASQGLLQRSSEGRIDLPQAVRAAIVARVSPASVRAAHLELARFYGRSHRTEAVRERFLHLVAGEAWKFAGDLLSRQEQTLLASGFSEALRSALRQLTLSSGSEPLRVRALRVEAQLLRVHSEYQEAISCLRRAASESQRDARVQAECYLSTVELHARLQQVREAEQALTEARRIAPSTRRLQVYFLHCEARILEARGTLVRARELFSETFQLARKASQPDLALEALARWSRLASMTTEREGIEPLIDAGIPEARDSGRMDIVFNLMSVRARNFVELGRTDEAMAELNRIRAEAEGLGYLSQLVYALSGLSALATELLRWDEAAGYARQASELAERLGNEVILGHTLAIRCSSELRQGHLDQARVDGERAVQVLSRLPPSDSLPMAHAYLAEVYGRQPDLERAIRHYNDAIRISETLGLKWWVERVRAELGPLLGIDTTALGTASSVPQGTSPDPRPGEGGGGSPPPPG